MCYVVSVVDGPKLFYKEAQVDATTLCYFATHISLVEEEITYTAELGT